MVLNIPVHIMWYLHLIWDLSKKQQVVIFPAISSIPCPDVCTVWGGC